MIELPEPELDNGTVWLRPWSGVDADDLVAAWTDEEVARFTAVPPTPDLTTARRWINGDHGRREQGLSLDLVISPSGERDVLGEVGLSSFSKERSGAAIGYWIAEDHRRQGHATAAVSLLLDWIDKTLELRMLVAHCEADNIGSHKVAEACGFTLAKTDPQGRLLYVRTP